MDYADLLDWWLANLATLPPDQLPQHVLVDEIQDLSPVQLEIIRKLLPADGRGFFGIGDPDQAIYGFRGVTGQSEDSLRCVWPDLTVYRLGRSFRSSQQVLDMARSLLRHKGQCGPLTAAHHQSAQLRLFSAPDQQAELRWITRRIQDLLGATAHTLLDQHLNSPDAHELDGTLAPGDIAVLVRLRAQIAPVRAALEQAGIPCAAPAEEAFWQDAACARLLSLAANHCGFAQMAQSLAGNATQSPSQSPEATASEGDCFTSDAPLPSPEAMEQWLAQTPWAGAPMLAGRAWRDLKRVWKTSGNWPEFLGQLGWLQEAEMVRGKAEHVQIMTMHASKGLEFEAVFLPGLEDGLLPLRRDRIFNTEPANAASGAALASHLDKDLAAHEEDEERRLLYVALTRAARALFVSHSARRSLYGKNLALAPSPFLEQIRQFCRQSALTPHKHTEMSHLSLLGTPKPEAN